jgi:GGDEF domain-containing protein
MSLQGPILIVAREPVEGLAQSLAAAGAFPVIEMNWSQARAGIAKINPSAIVASEPGAADMKFALAAMQLAATATPLIPVIVRVPDDTPSTLPDAVTISEHAPGERLASMLRVRALHATVLGRAQTLEAERNIVAEIPDGDPIDHATVLLVGRGRHHPTLSVAVGERMGVIGALSIGAAARCLRAREVDGIIIGDGLQRSSVDAFLTVLAEDSRFRDLPVAVLGDSDPLGPPNHVHARDPIHLFARALPLIRLHAFEMTLKRLLSSIEHKGMLDPQTGLLNANAFGRELSRAIDDASARGVGFSLARFGFDQAIDHRTSIDAARLVSRLVRSADFAARQTDGSILFAFADTDLRAAHVAARRLASVLKHTMLQPDHGPRNVSPTVTLATLKPADTVLTLLSRVVSRPVAAA